MIKFGTGGWRAVIGSDFIEKNICYVAEGICRLMEEDGKTDKPTMIGYDHRFLSVPAARWMAEVFAAHGLTVWFMNRSAPTPLVMHTVKRKGIISAWKSPPATTPHPITASSSLWRKDGMLRWRPPNAWRRGSPV